MSIAAVIGADAFGGAIAHKISARDRFGEVRLIDPSVGIAAGKAMDIQQAAAVESFHTKVTAHRDIDAVTGASVIVLTREARTADGASAEETDLANLRRASAFNRRAVIVCADPSHRRVVGRGVSDLGIPRRQLIGSAPAAFQSALRAIVGVELRCSPSEVALAVLGTPPEHVVIPWNEVTVRGYPLSSQLTPTRLGLLRTRAPSVWPPGPYTVASTTARVSEAVIAGSEMRGLSVFYVLDGELGTRGTSAAVTVELGATGVTRVLEPELTVQERVQLETALLAP